MSDFAIRVRGLSKSYQIYASPRDRLKQFLVPPLQRAFGMRPKAYYQEFWAVRDVSLDVPRGETVGIIGRNGSGKSTLLQMICGTLSPTAGSVETDGRVAALLELGSGFNPEFTGLENVYLNGAVLGLSRDEVSARLADILAFADIGDFVHQPVKTYSSGMFVRLAFAVAMHASPDILVVDEALSVGDAFFQAKSAAAMKALMESGTTVLFVSHDTHAVKALCSKAILLDQGGVIAQGDAVEVVEAYYTQRVGGRAPPPPQVASTPGSETARAVSSVLVDPAGFSERASYQRILNGGLRFLEILLLNAQGEQTDAVEFRERVTLRMVVTADDDMPIAALAYHIRDMKGVEIVYADTSVGHDRRLKDLAAGEVRVIDWAFDAALQEGQYNFACMASVPRDLRTGDVQVCDFIPFALQFRVSRGSSLPIYALVHWDNEVSERKLRSTE